MQQDRVNMRDLLSAVQTASCTFRKEERGSISIFALFMVFIMLMLTGVGADLMRHEMERTRIQAVADRAVLAAADLDQTLSPQAVVQDYFAKSGMESFISDVSVDQGLNYKTVRVDATSKMKTQFMDFLGQKELTVPAIAEAEERVSKVEISLVLDISGSMGRNNRMERLHVAGTEFLETILSPNKSGLTSVSIVPYTAQVNAGKKIFDELNVTAQHNFSHCVDFTAEDFNSAAISQTKQYEHMQHFDMGWSWNGNRSPNSITNPGCPKRGFEEIEPFSENLGMLRARVNQLQARANTAIHIGMKWGVALLDPSFNSILTELPGISQEFQNRPAPYSDQETLKTVILMTDGENVTTYRINGKHYRNNSHRRHWSIYPLGWYLDNYVPWQDHPDWAHVRYTAPEADTMLQNVCNAAKANNIVIWTIGFEVSDHGANVMRDCASSPSHFFRVEGVEISDAFSAIARQIAQLRLTQ